MPIKNVPQNNERRKGLPKKKLVALLVVAALIAAACSSDTGEDIEAAGDTVAAAEAESELAEREPEPEPEPEPEEVTESEFGDGPGGFPIVNQLEADFLNNYNSTEVDVLDSTIHYVTTGTPADNAIILLHGQPTSSFLWRDVLPHLEGAGYVVAPDLIGMGRSGQPDIAYSIDDNLAYFDSFVESLDIETVTLVLHDVGGFVGLGWAADNPERVSGVVLMETGFAPVPNIDDLVVPGFSEILPIVRDPATPDSVSYDIFVEQFLAEANGGLDSDVHDVYRATWAEGRNLTPLAQWPRNLPIGGEPEAAVISLSGGFDWIVNTEVPKILLHGEPGLLMAADTIPGIQALIPGLESGSVGPGAHYLQEESPDGVGEALVTWISDNDL